MASDTIAEKTFNFNLFWWKIFGLWLGRDSSKCYKYYSFIYLITTLGTYNSLLTLNLIYTPRSIETLIREFIFYFTEVAVASKALMVLFMRTVIINTFEILDSDLFKGNDEKAIQIIERHTLVYRSSLKWYAVMNNVAFFMEVLPPLFLRLIFNKYTELPISNYYFLSESTRESYFYFWYCYQTIGMYGHMVYNFTIDTFIAGLIYMGVGQFRLLKHALQNLNTSKSESSESMVIMASYEENIRMYKLKNCLIHYNMLLTYCKYLQKICSVAMFFQFGVSAVIICVVLCAFTLDLKTETYIFMVLYLFVMTMGIFLPGWTGTLLTFESQEISKAAYNGAWISTSEPYKKCLNLFMERTKKPVILIGLKMFPLSLGTFTSITKMAYSLFALIRNIQKP